MAKEQEKKIISEEEEASKKMICGTNHQTIIKKKESKKINPPRGCFLKELNRIYAVYSEQLTLVNYENK